MYIIGSVNVCTNFEINRYEMGEFRKHACMLYLTSCMAQTVVFMLLVTLPLIKKNDSTGADRTI